MKNIHQAAQVIVNLPELPDLDGCGLCFLLKSYTGEIAYAQMRDFDPAGSRWPDYGQWTDQRLNFLCFLAITTPEDFE